MAAKEYHQEIHARLLCVILLTLGQILGPVAASPGGSSVRGAELNYVFAEATNSRLNSSNPLDAKLLDILKRDGPDMRPSRDFKDFEDINEEIANRAWRLIREHALVAARDRVKLARPIVDEVLASAEVGQECRQAVDEVFEGALRMETWAVKLLEAWGNFPPTGLLEGTYSEVGAFETCTNSPENPFVGHAHYCSVTFRPVLAKRKDYDLVVRKEPESLRKLFRKTSSNGSLASSSSSQTDMKDIFEDLVEHAQYNHFVYYKIGTCWPIKCSPLDVKRVVKLISLRNILMSGPVKCYSKFRDDYEQEITANDTKGLSHTSLAKSKKLVVSVWDLNDGIYVWKPYFNDTQQVALIVILAVTGFIAFMSLVDLIFSRIPKLVRKFKFAMRGLTIYDPRTAPPVSSGASIPSTSLTNGNGSPQQQLTTDQVYRGDFAMANNSSQIFTFREVDGLNTNSKVLRRTSEIQTFRRDEPRSCLMSIVDECSIITNTAQFFTVSQGQLKNDILCLNGIRCITMAWIMMTHTMMYNDWSAFGRTRKIEESLKSGLSQPFFNGSYLVDSFFLMSGLLSSFTAFKHSQGLAKKFNSIAFIFGRWLRLTPQILFASMIYIVLPALSSGPHWWPIVGEYSENCVENWWVNVLHLQAFYRTEKMCNFVTWWISIDFFYHFFALALIWIVLLFGHRIGFLSMCGLVLSQVIWQIIRHFQLSLPPNIFATIPQTGAMWRIMTLGFYWTPYTHAVAFFFGFYTGYLLALKRHLVLRHLNTRRALFGWIATVVLLLVISFSTYWWVVGEAQYSRYESTIFYTIAPIIWASSLCWVIIACHHGYGGFINRMLSCNTFIILGKASYFVYLSHFQVLFMFYGNQSFLLEPTPYVMVYIIVGNTILSTIWGIFLCVVYELPWLKQQRKLMKFV